MFGIVVYDGGGDEDDSERSAGVLERPGAENGRRRRRRRQILPEDALNLGAHLPPAKRPSRSRLPAPAPAQRPVHLHASRLNMSHHHHQLILTSSRRTFTARRSTAPISLLPYEMNFVAIVVVLETARTPRADLPVPNKVMTGRADRRTNMDVTCGRMRPPA